MRRRLIAWSVLVAVIGLSSALVIHLRAGTDSGFGEDVQTIIVDGKSHQIPLTSLKTYRRDLERFGGPAAVLADDFMRWLAGLWHGRSLAYTVAWITAFASVGLLLVARLCPDG